jgi:hypothetical protein
MPSRTLIALASGIACLSLVVRTRVSAEEISGLVPGAHVRVFTRQGTRNEGTLRSIDLSKVALEIGENAPDAPRLKVFPRDSVTRMDLRLAGSKKGRGALIGVVAVVALSGAVALAAPNDCDRHPNSCDVPRAAVFGGLAIYGAPVGAAIGALVAPGARWQEDVSPNGFGGVRIGVTTGPNRRGVGLALAIPLKPRSRKEN